MNRARNAGQDLPARQLTRPGAALAAGAIETVNKGVQLSAITGPDGNTIALIGNFRIKY